MTVLNLIFLTFVNLKVEFFLLFVNHFFVFIKNNYFNSVKLYFSTFRLVDKILWRWRNIKFNVIQFCKILTVMACITICGSAAFSLLTMERKQSLACCCEFPTLSQMSIITAQSSVVFFSLVAFSVQNQNQYLWKDSNPNY